MKQLEYSAIPQKMHSLKGELAAIVNTAKPCVEAIYKLEGSSILPPECYEIKSSLSAFAKNGPMYMQF